MITITISTMTAVNLASSLSILVYGVSYMGNT